ncbi:hypothetical protein [Alteromonas gilva]|uniref:DUF3016 domain-containing protein n=1 Tax=Alteromonas gilva TaxID=2987522 RepID=A0ABT5L7Z0_9ALTE|nr:hypothetical protein [Alteromonas gilva]MDC8833012.1 hypothetical protein [Alteromonas gilva]
MLKHPLIIFLSLTLLLLVNYQAAAVETNSQQPAEVSTSGLSCAEPAQNFIPLLGRGTADVETFLIRDLQQELVRQDEHSVLVSIVCTNDAVVKGSTIEVQEDGETKQALSKLLVTFPLTLKVQNRRSLITLDVNLHYLTEHLEAVEGRNTTITFEVLKQR